MAVSWAGLHGKRKIQELRACVAVRVTTVVFAAFGAFCFVYEWSAAVGCQTEEKGKRRAAASAAAVRGGHGFPFFP